MKDIFQREYLMTKIEKLRKFNTIASIVTLFVLAVTMLVLAFIPIERDHNYLGVIIITSSIVHLATFSIGGGFRNKNKIIDFTFFILAIIVSLVFFIFGQISIQIMCIIWGGFDILRNVAHLISSIIEVRENKLEIMEMVAAVMEIIFSILLIFEKDAGITVHLVVMASAYSIFGSKFLIDYFQEESHHKVE